MSQSIEEISYEEAVSTYPQCGHVLYAPVRINGKVHCGGLCKQIGKTR